MKTTEHEINIIVFIAIAGDRMKAEEVVKATGAKPEQIQKLLTEQHIYSIQNEHGQWLQVNQHSPIRFAYDRLRDIICRF